ncbi:MAG: deaminase [Candidatus Raymondbacteria bacterium RifOxyA12_full_50_37]|uniref:Deaminase n=1 Tax=Candidatus Raymondbacteria bacterium RIFOXYD12_FULL_49_13 TaxID=1817890 RepID=A0A1F7FKV0_UNCRA|nr:MAG: deaminase [Candidatus Raymondbacteria bacterium RifOxyA12_full_50_37]OGJ85466.1 MAG: deaminase [Candidatus Raymondbacteria bacterium RIFOXYA2_FULL_49_16]OGJ94974.1 MAG: deaminase [Candidatus Raymondbacteria bacterium RIFOXYC2_FULL_50_21]OGJ99405.1 MAG: deaminase [Candidatus Raymondbacteria bacterium RifOxyB12_full_50_8]OGK01896.1 MAG: deaminase [Candidatus Raymondbacteria bacterium RifOxyC12_full_50_8]OGK07354.1 MAG: deaminase [Candidatus Raymondbacteria bacterium RIFOXYD12_FULL_49_13]
MGIAHAVSHRSTCDRNHVGAVIVRDNTVLATGYNGSVRGLPHCAKTGHMMVNGHCTTTVHAEVNAIVQAARIGVAIQGGAMYVTSSPCWNCFKLIANAGITKICYGKEYGTDTALVKKYARRAGIILKRTAVLN